MIAHVSKTLNDDPLALQLTLKSRLCDVFRVTEKFLQSILDAAASCLGPPLDAACIDRLASHTGRSVNVGGIHALILIRDPRHFPLTCAHIWGGHVLGRMDQVALDQLIGETAGDLFQLLDSPFGRVNA